MIINFKTNLYLKIIPIYIFFKLNTLSHLYTFIFIILDIVFAVYIFCVICIKYVSKIYVFWRQCHTKGVSSNPSKNISGYNFELKKKELIGVPNWKITSQSHAMAMSWLSNQAHFLCLLTAFYVCLPSIYIKKVSWLWETLR